MKFIKAIAVAALAINLVGCQYAGDLTKFAVVGVDNPITEEDLLIIEQSYKTVLNPTVYYLERRTCKRSEDELTSWTVFAPFNPCHQYARAVTVRAALQNAQTYRRQLSQFVKANRTVDAQVAYAELMKAIAVMQQVPKQPGG